MVNLLRPSSCRSLPKFGRPIAETLARAFVARRRGGENATSAWLQGMLAAPGTRSRAPYANMLRLRLRARLRFRSRRRRPDMLDTWARAPGRRQELSTRRRRDNA